VEHPQDRQEAIRCRYCGEVIGVYEPLVTCISGAPVRTSRAALGSDTDLAERPSYHADCYARRESLK